MVNRKKSDDEKKSEIIPVRFKKEDRKRFKKEAKKLKISVSEYIRRKVLSR